MGRALIAWPGQGRAQLYAGTPVLALAGRTAGRARHAAVALADWGALGGTGYPMYLMGPVPDVYKHKMDPI